jgi:outer membrane lipoprotein-sorting protein
MNKHMQINTNDMNSKPGIRTAVLMLLMLFLSLGVAAQVPEGFKVLKDTSSFIQKMTAQSKLTNTMESDFEQEKYISVMSEKIVSKGHFCFKKANKLRWEYINPFKYLIVINGAKMFIKDNGKVSKYDINSNKIFKSINEMMMNIVQGTLFNNKEYSAKYYENDKQYLLVLSPTQKGTKEFLKTINLYINKSDYAVTKVKMIEPGSDYTTLNFTNRKTNEPIADEKFVVK